MHFMSQPRYNPRTQRDDWYYRIKESFRDLTGRVRSRVMLNQFNNNKAINSQLEVLKAHQQTNFYLLMGIYLLVYV